MRTTWPSLVLALGLHATAAWSQDNTVFAQQRFTRGSSFYEARDYTHALDEFRASLALYGSPNTRLYIARCLRDLGRLDEAVPEFERAVREAGDRASTDPRYAATRDAAQAELTAIEPRVGRLTLNIPNAPANIVVRVNGRELPREALGVAFPVMPGGMTITAEAVGFHVETRQTEVMAGNEVTVGIVMRARPQGEGQTEITGPGRNPATPRASGGVPRSLAWVGVGVGAAGLIGFGVFAALAESRFSSLQTTCGGVACPESLRGDVDGGRTLQTLTNVSLGIGIAGVVAGTVLFLVGRPSETQPPPRSVRVGFTGRAVTLEGAF